MIYLIVFFKSYDSMTRHYKKETLQVLYSKFCTESGFKNIEEDYTIVMCIMIACKNKRTYFQITLKNEQKASVLARLELYECRNPNRKTY